MPAMPLPPAIMTRCRSRPGRNVACPSGAKTPSRLPSTPSPTSQAPLKEALILGGEMLVTVVVGYLLIPRRARHVQ